MATARPARTDQIGSSYTFPAPAAPTRLDQYLATIPEPMRRGRARKSLERQQGFAGQFHTRAAYAEANFRTLRIEFGRDRVWTNDSTFFAISDVTVAFADYVVWLQQQAA